MENPCSGNAANALQNSTEVTQGVENHDESVTNAKASTQLVAANDEEDGLAVAGAFASAAVPLPSAAKDGVDHGACNDNSAHSAVDHEKEAAGRYAFIDLSESTLFGAAGETVADPRRAGALRRSLMKRNQAAARDERKRAIAYDATCADVEEGRAAGFEDRLVGIFEVTCWTVACPDEFRAMAEFDQISVREDTFETPCLRPVYYLLGDAVSSAARGQRSKSLRIIDLALREGVRISEFRNWYREKGGLNAAWQAAVNAEKQRTSNAGGKQHKEAQDTLESLVKHLPMSIQLAARRDLQRAPIYVLPPVASVNRDRFSLILCRAEEVIGALKLSQREIAKLVGKHGIAGRRDDDDIAA